MVAKLLSSSLLHYKKKKEGDGNNVTFAIIAFFVALQQNIKKKR